MQTDETRVPVLNPTLRKTKSGRLWVFVGDRNPPMTVYDYRPDTTRVGPAEILKNYRGFLQADAANVFDGLYVPDTITEVGCLAHARRYVHDARTSAPTRAAFALARIAGCYAVEHEANQWIAQHQLPGEAADHTLRVSSRSLSPSLSRLRPRRRNPNWMDDFSKPTSRHRTHPVCGVLHRTDTSNKTPRVARRRRRRREFAERTQSYSFKSCGRWSPTRSKRWRDRYGDGGTRPVPVAAMIGNAR